jgi:hypothetical protein
MKGADGMTFSDRSLRLAAAITSIWGLVFAGFHFYWAAGGGVGIDEGQQTAAESLYIAFIALLGLLGAAVARGVYRPWGGRIGRDRLRLVARSGGVVLLLGVTVGVGRWIAAGSLGDDGGAGVVITLYFLLGALLFSALGWQRVPQRRVA